MQLELHGACKLLYAHTGAAMQPCRPGGSTQQNTPQCWKKKHAQTFRDIRRLIVLEQTPEEMAADPGVTEAAVQLQIKKRQFHTILWHFSFTTPENLVPEQRFRQVITQDRITTAFTGMSRQKLYEPDCKKAKLPLQRWHNILQFPTAKPPRNDKQYLDFEQNSANLTRPTRWELRPMIIPPKRLRLV